MKKQKRLTLILAGTWTFLLLLSMIFFFFGGNEKETRVLFFPRYRTADCVGEERVLPRKKTPELEIELLLKEILLGPFDVNSVPVVPRDVQLRTVLLRDNRLFVDFSEDIVFRDVNSTLSFEEALECINRSIQFNFPVVEKIVYTVNGTPPKLTEK